MIYKNLENVFICASAETVKASIIHNSGDDSDPFTIVDCTEPIFAKTAWIAENTGELIAVRNQEEEYFCPMGRQCSEPYECWYIRHCTGDADLL